MTAGLPHTGSCVTLRGRVAPSRAEGRVRPGDVGRKMFTRVSGTVARYIGLPIHLLRLLAISLSFTVGLLSPASAEIIFLGVPETQIYSTGEQSISKTLGTGEVDEFRLVISNENGKFYWTSRENKQLEQFISGIFDIYVAVDGSGLIKIQTIDADTIQPLDQSPYFEFLHLHLQSVTYFGSGVLTQ